MPVRPSKISQHCNNGAQGHGAPYYLCTSWHCLIQWPAPLAAAYVSAGLCPANLSPSCSLSLPSTYNGCGISALAQSIINGGFAGAKLGCDFCRRHAAIAQAPDFETINAA